MSLICASFPLPPDMLSLDTARLLDAAGNPLSRARLRCSPTGIRRRHIYTAVASIDGISLMGQGDLREEELRPGYFLATAGKYPMD